ncbi:MAG TPA: cytochrome c oxidase assembly protein [Xanthomonadaceae bacterium]|nr:cytochrome c oxidase assembly protein [Xanthomonadaceae bacterium]
MSTMQAQQAVQHRRLIGRALAACVIAFGLGFFVMPPLYRIACEQIFGIRLDQGVASPEVVGSYVVDNSRTVVVEFDATVNSRLMWQFKPTQARMEVHPGELYEATYIATNISSRSVVGNAVPSVAPSSASLYFNKTECFCFTEQLLAAGESREMPVRFVVDPALPAGVRTVTLSYVFFQNDIATEREQRDAVAHTSTQDSISG